LNALIFDCDGVLAETERDAHLPAFNRAFAEFELGIHWTPEVYAEKLRVAGGKERIATSLTGELISAHLPADTAARRAELAAAVHARKSEIFEGLLAEGAVTARPGVRRLIGEAAAAGWRLAVASTSAESSVRAVVEQVLEPEDAARLAIFAGDVVAAKKPDPAIYELAVATLGVAREQTVVIEDSRNGLLAASTAGLRCIITVSEFSSTESFAEASLVLSSLGEPTQPLTVLANRSPAAPHTVLTLADLAAVLSTPAA
jgi:HAD superfamily hydrolase (TIGR01509 family)